MLAIFKRELKAYFTTLIGYIYIAVTMFIIGLGFFSYNLYQEFPYFSYTIQGCTLVLLVTVPFLTMRLFTEDKKKKTDRLIYTSTVSEVAVVIGKFLAAFAVFVIPCVISCIYPLILNRFGIVPLGESYIALFGFVLYGMACISIGMFISSVSVNQVVSAIITFIALLLGYMMASIIALMTSSKGLITSIFGLYDLSTPLNYMTNGVIDFVSIIYYLSLAALFLTLTVLSVKRHSIVFSRKNVGVVKSIIGIITSVAVFAVVNISVGFIPEKFMSADYSYNKIFSLTDETKNFIRSIDKDISVYVLCPRNNYDEYVVKMLDNYTYESDRIKVEYIDLTKNPRFFVPYTDTIPAEGSFIVESGDRSIIVDYESLFEFDYSNIYYSDSKEVSGFDGEGQLNSAIDYVCGGSMSTVFVITGHGEAELSEKYIGSFEKENIKYQPVILSDYASIPADIGGVIINGPIKDYSPDDVTKITDFLDKGGRILITLALTDEKQDNFEELLDYMDIREEKGLIIENNPNYYYENVNYLQPEVATTVYTENLSDFPVLPNSMSILTNESVNYVSYDSLMVTTDEAFLKKHYNESVYFNENDGDIEGPFTVGVEARCQIVDDSGMVMNPVMIVFSSSDIFTDEMDSFSSNSNNLLFRNIISTFNDRGKNITVNPKMLSLPYLNISGGSRNVMVFLTMFLIPISVLVYGVYVCLKRRRY